MSLRAFHLFFIGCAAVFSLFFCAWAYLEHQRTRAPANLIESALGLAVSGCLVAYFLWAQKSYRALDNPDNKIARGHL